MVNERVRQASKIKMVDPLLDTEWIALAHALTGEWEPFFHLLHMTGLRTSEALNLRAKDIQPVGLDWIIWVSRLKTRREPKPVKIRLSNLVFLKNGLTLGATLAILGRRKQPRIFKYSRVAAWKALKRFCRVAGIRELTPHQFRHTFGVATAERQLHDKRGRLLSPLEHKKVLSRMLGHSSERWAEIYYEPHDDHVADIQADMADYMANRSKG